MPFILHLSKMMKAKEVLIHNEKLRQHPALVLSVELAYRKKIHELKISKPSKAISF